MKWITYFFIKHKLRYLILSSLFFFTFGFGSSPRLLITLGPECDFTLEQLQKDIDAHVITGSINEIKAKVMHLDRNHPNHQMILEKYLDNMYSFSRQVGYATLYLNDKYKNALSVTKETIASIPLTDADLPRMNPKEVGLFYDLMMKIDRVFKEQEIPYWATCGTLLGVVRHQGMIPWDDDMDIAIFEKDVYRLCELREVLAGMGLGLAYNSYFEFYKIFFLDGEPIIRPKGEQCSWTYPFVDIFPMSELATKVTYSGGIWQDQYKRQDYYLPSDLTFPLPELPFGPMMIPVSHHPLNYLDRMYGLDWNEVAYVSYSHKQEKTVMKVKVDLLDRSAPPYILPNK